MGATSAVDWAALVASLAYKPGWVFKVGGPDRAFLCIFATTPDSMRLPLERTTQHMFRLPEWETVVAGARWVFGCLLQAELHEACEFFAVDGFRPHFPHHQEEGSPYELVDRWEA